ncbi:MAG TPA: succinyl-diaminopimelate desuccinylase [Xanthomonadales bacterium]|nr:succinyl-diaminopimelate desuccinylase [Xanthomonadales bacterium]
MSTARLTQVAELACQLVSRASVTPEDAGCQQLLADRLLALGFEARWFFCGEVSNLLLTYGHGSPSLWFLGHTDVVPPGAEDLWTYPPFEPTARDGFLYGRGIADMKGAVAAMACALETFVQQNAGRVKGQLGLLLTSDEEGVAVNGITRVADDLAQFGGAPNYCLVGEPSSQKVLGDCVRIGRRGSMNGRLRVIGVQGHTAFPHLLDNPVHGMAGFLEELVSTAWDQGNADFPPTSCQVSMLRAGQGATNVTPADALLQFNLRNCPESPSAVLQQRIEAMIKKQGISNFELEWTVSGEPFYSKPGLLRDATLAACREVLQTEPDANTGGGTSDGRFMAPLGTEVVELGLLNTSIHKVDECIPLADLDRLFAAYYDILRRINSP